MNLYKSIVVLCFGLAFFLQGGYFFFKTGSVFPLTEMFFGLVMITEVTLPKGKEK